MEAFNIYAQIERLDKAGLLYMVISKYADEIDLSPEKVPNDLMGYIFEELIRRFSEISNETAGEHFTPREVIRLMVSLIFNEDGAELSEDGKMTSLYDPAAGTGGMLAIGSDYLKSLNQTIYVDCYGQELNPMTYAVCKSDMLIKGQQYDRIYRGNSFTEDGTAGKAFSYMLCNPPFGVEWKKYDKAIKEENEKLGFAGRFGAGLPRISDGSFLFLQHMISKMKPVDEGGSRIAIVFNGSPLFTGDAGSGESEIRRWIIENDWLETIVALPDQMFYNTGISTYIWIVTNRKSRLRQGKIQLINAADFSEKMRKSLGSKRNQITDTQINEIVGIHKDFLPNEYSKIFDNEDFGYWKVTVERPVRYNFSCCEDRVYSLPIVFQKKKNCTWSWSQNDLDGQPMPQDLIDLKNDLVALGNEVYTDEKQFKVLIAPVVKKHKLTAVQQRTLLYNVLSAEDENGTIYLDAKGNQVANTSLRDYETIPLKTDIQEYFEQEVLSHVPDAWIDESKTKKGYEIPFTRQFYKYVPLRESSVILSEIKALEDKIQADIAGLFE